MEMQAYLSFLDELGRKLNELAQLEQKKLTAVRAGDLDTVQQYMKREQAAALDLRGREQKRKELLRQMGLEQFSLRELPAHCPPEHRAKVQEVTQRVLNSYRELSSAQGAARTLMEANLRHIEKELEQRQKTQPVQAVPHHGGPTDFRA